MRRTVAILGIFWAGIALADMGGSFQQGKDLGSAATGGAFSEINSGAAAGKVPAYGTSPAEAQYYQGGQGQLAGPGIAKTQGCASYTPGSDPTANQECEAVNFLARNPQIRPQFNITKNDPMILGAQSARNNAETFFQSIGINGGAGSSTQCTTRTETTPAQYTTQTCSSIKELGTQQCTMGRVVNIETDANFQCNQTVNAYENLSCDDSTLACTVSGVQLQCAPTSTLCASWADSCCWINVVCNANGSATVNHGDCCGYSYSNVVSDVSQFLSGVAYNPAGAKVTCSNSGACSMTFENYYCSSPSVSIGHYDNVNSFNMSTRPVFACTEGGGCEALDARTR